ncbi:CRISPR system precrRNA processing endoribonuclease RAMP protein Cas6 [Marinifilum sp. D714]|uniref:CRISPR system precrRNA processing endoribonuclease RAMP protein Cas6 n=1 Tax=Marinifilum sp. D714 TaxID=2937523 RepID=UPI0027C7461D|nr:CRISPR system precrRNA processing endoribonuclease RAMP protein Cas6 [Marinifilum sp. D714]MDQ2178595.1 hypothetical protein [Marinifilum sp. D714]
MNQEYNKLFFYQYKIVLKLRTDHFELPTSPFAFFHGLFGQVLYNVNGHAGTKHIRCNKENCSYCQLFKPVLPDGHFWKGKYTNPPIGYVLSPALNEKTEYTKAEKMEFHLALIGSANKHLPNIIMAFSQMHKYAEHSVVSNFLLESFESVLPNKQDTAMDNRFSLENISAIPDLNTTKLRTHTPLHLQSGKHLIEEKLVEQLLQQAHTKYNLLAQFYCGSPLSKIENMALPEMNYEVHIHRLEVWKNKRYGKKIKVDAIAGEFTNLSENILSYTELLVLIRYLGIGKYSSYGLGKLSW